MAKSKSWREIRGELALNETRVDAYRRLMDAQLEIAEFLLECGLVSEEQLDEAMAASQVVTAGDDQQHDLYLDSLTRFVAALGGRLEVQAVFPGASLTVLRRDPVEPAGDAPKNQRPGSEAS